MKLYTTTEQTAKLIELGFEKPCSIASVEPIYGMGGISVAKAYSIGELIEMLPRVIGLIGQDYVTIEISHDAIHWIVGYTDFEDRLTYAASSSELIDAVFNMIVKLKEKELI